MNKFEALLKKGVAHIYTTKDPLFIIDDIKVTKNSITINKFKDAEYSKDKTNWQEANTFSGLTAETQYTIYIKHKDSNNIQQITISTTK